MDEQIARIEAYIEHLELERLRHDVAHANAIASAQMILAMLRDGSPLPSEEQTMANTAANTEEAL